MPNSINSLKINKEVSVMRNLLVIFSIYIFLFFTGCKSDSTISGSSNSGGSLFPYMPLKVGNIWKFERTNWIIGGGTIIDTSSMEVVKIDTVMSGKLAYKIQEEDNNYIWLIVIEDELRMYNVLPNATADYYIFLKAPLTVGNQWIFYSKPVGGIYLYAKIVSLNETINVPAGQFSECIHVSVSPYFHAWLKENVGTVRIGNANLDSTSGIDEKLKYYHLE